MKFLQVKWPFWVNALLLIFMVILGTYLFNDVIGFSGVFHESAIYTTEMLSKQDVPPVYCDWQLGMLGGVFIGGLCGSLINRSWKLVLAFEDAKGMSGKSLGTAFWGILSGFLVMLGAILGGETFYGQVAAAMEMSAGAWCFLLTTLITAGILALFIERRGSGGKSKDAGKGDSK